MFDVKRGLGTAIVAVLLLAACAPKPAKPAPAAPPESAQARPSEAALGPVRPVDVESCAETPDNGQVLAGESQAEGDSFFYITNETEVRAIIKVRNEADNRLVIAAYVGPKQSATVGPIVDGTYRATFALGRDFAPDCSSLEFPSGYSQAEEADTFTTRMENGELVGRTQNYVLTDDDVDGGDGRQALSADKFNAP